ncbi:tripartite terminase subunit 3 [Elysia marginata]|uniref:Tripartite terminase subunit 3 n=1 Tax=Elysia marginata TaxID=1093978 RepID=A0AAV4FYF6_9GAST|nr:tripartite terminase subunit 3 [Elysia marginata]
MRMARRKADTYMLRRLCYDTLRDRQINKSFYTYNPALVFTEGVDFPDVAEFDELARNLYGDPPPEVDQDGDAPNSSSPPVRGAKKLMDLLRTLVPYVQFNVHYHDTVLSSPWAVHQMFQKSVAYETLFHAVNVETNSNALENFVLASNDAYYGFTLASLNSVCRLYTGRQMFAVILRGMGKTSAITTTTAVALMTLPRYNVLHVAHLKPLVLNTIREIKVIITEKFPEEVYGYIIRMMEDCLVIIFIESGNENKLSCRSGSRDSTVRGVDPNVVFVDESYCLSKGSYTSINAFEQRYGVKIIWVTSPVVTQADLLMEMLAEWRNKCRDMNLYRISFYCMNNEHSQYSNEYMGCYKIMYASRHNTYNNTSKNFESLITRSADTFANEMGVVRMEDIDRTLTSMQVERPVFSREFRDYLSSPEPFVNLDALPRGSVRERRDEIAYWIYMDPAYHASQTSAVALACVRFLPSSKKMVLCFLDRKLLSQGDIGYACDIMEQMYSACVLTLVKRSGGAKCNFFVAIERNSNPDAVRTNYYTWVDLRNRESGRHVLSKNNCEFFAYVADVTRTAGPVYGYLLGSTKSHMVASMANFFNNKHRSTLLIADTVEFGRFTPDVCTIDLLQKEIDSYRFHNGKYTGKHKHGTDDMITSLINVTYLMCSFKGSVMNRIDNYKDERNRPCSLPWININCKCHHVT